GHRDRPHRTLGFRPRGLRRRRRCPVPARRGAAGLRKRGDARGARAALPPGHPRGRRADGHQRQVAPGPRRPPHRDRARGHRGERGRSRARPERRL
ncbi:MAG: hypothetical protein AVDCRST_MAG53-357, partial [uncultured Solirubrobacteraceae bacterium]